MAYINCEFNNNLVNKYRVANPCTQECTVGTFGKEDSLKEKACEAQLLWANACVSSDAVDCNPCFDPDSFLGSFPKDVEAQFRTTTMSYVPPTDRSFCDETNRRVCRYYEKVQVRKHIDLQENLETKHARFHNSMCQN
jgi:hypothetical protein